MPAGDSRDAQAGHWHDREHGFGRGLCFAAVGGRILCVEGRAPLFPRLAAARTARRAGTRPQRSPGSSIRVSGSMRSRSAPAAVRQLRWVVSPQAVARRILRAIDRRSTTVFIPRIGALFALAGLVAPGLMEVVSAAFSPPIARGRRPRTGTAPKRLRRWRRQHSSHTAG